ncbi:MAG: TonB-dependent receptor [Tannerella sp.]|nr:TonB-dependent receptor [Tannerella sp.]
MLVLMAFAPSMQAQTTRVSGTVTDGTTGEPIIGANILQVGSTNGAVTDIDGKFTLNAPRNANLRVSSVGYTTQTVAVPNSDNPVLNIALSEDTELLEEVVVVGYGTQRKSDVTGSISIATSQDILRVPTYNALAGLKGIASGVNVFVNSGMPGGNTRDRVVIRGISSINAVTDPLYVVDGVATENFQFMNPNEIERMEVLKDASATAIYGARGAQGVILVTTKRGSSVEGTSVSYDGYVSVATLGRKMETLNAAEYMQAYKIGMQNAVKYGGFSEEAMTDRWTAIAQNSSLNPNYQDLFRINGTFNPLGWKDLNDNSLEPIYDTNWQEEASQNGITHSHQLNILTGGKNSSTGVFLSYMDQEGLLVQTYFKRVTARISNDAKLLPWLSSSMSVSVNHNWQRDTPESGGLDASRMLIEMPAIFPVKYEDGTWSNTTAKINGFGYEAGPNPVHYLNAREEMRYRTIMTGNFELTFHLAKGWDLKTRLGLNGNIEQRRRFYPFGVINQDNSGKGQIELNDWYTVAWEESTYLTYNTVADKHRISAMAGAEWSERTRYEKYLDIGTFPTNAFGVNNIASATEDRSKSSAYQRTAMNSYFGRAAYTYDDKYIATLTARMDGSSRFGENNKYAFFPSLGLGWMVSNEEFMQNVSWINNLKLHASVGSAGNDNIDPYRSLAPFSIGNILVNGQRVSSANPSRLANPDLKWEKTTTYDFGFNLNTLENRLNFDISLYYKYTNDLLLDAPIPNTSGFGSIFKNTGAISNRGLDAMISGVIAQSRDFQWTSTLNANYNASKVEKLNDGGADILLEEFVGAQVILRVGEPVSQFWGYERLGIKDAAYVAANGGRVGTALRSADKTVIGKGFPEWTGSFINRFSYKNLELTVDLQFSLGSDIRQDFSHSTEDRFGLTSGLRTILTEAWTEGKPTNVPNQVQAIRIGSFDGQDSNGDSRWVAKGDYLRGNLIQLAYNFAPQMAKSIGISALRTYVSVNNAFVLTDPSFRGYDPEGSTRGTFFGQNVFFFNYPKPRTWTLGLNVTF